MGNRHTHVRMARYKVTGYVIFSCPVFYFTRSLEIQLKREHPLNGNSWRAKRQGAIGLERQITVGTATDMRERERETKKQRGHK